MIQGASPSGEGLRRVTDCSEKQFKHKSKHPTPCSESAGGEPGGGPDSQVQRGITKFIKPGIHLAPEPSFQPLPPLRALRLSSEVPAARCTSPTLRESGPRADHCSPPACTVGWYIAVAGWPEQGRFEFPPSTPSVPRWPKTVSCLLMPTFLELCSIRCEFGNEHAGDHRSIDQWSVEQRRICSSGSAWRRGISV